MTLRVVRPDERDLTTSQTSGMRREAGVSKETTGSKRLWVGYATTPPGDVSGVHHHGDCETAIYVARGRARFRYGDRLEHEVEVGPGDFLYLEPMTIHMEENLSPDEPVEFIVSRACDGMLVVNVPDPRLEGS